MERIGGRYYNYMAFHSRQKLKFMHHGKQDIKTSNALYERAKSSKVLKSLKVQSSSKGQAQSGKVVYSGIIISTSYLLLLYNVIICIILPRAHAQRGKVVRRRRPHKNPPILNSRRICKS